ncbi:hypothetical protein FQN57_002763 [Myotisia sp. PD_48]|nr:hypothetical protein FQN57_002763 [Myotisia sp. PD_48]
MNIDTDPYPAKKHAKRVAEKLAEAGHGTSGIIFIEGQKSQLLEDCDEPVPFRQRRNFFYLSGCLLPDCALAYNIGKEELTLFIPPVDPDSVIWSGLPLSPADALKEYDVDVVLPTTEINAHLAHYCSGETGETKVFAIPNQVSAEITFLPFQTSNFDVLRAACDECRIIKDEYEIALLRRANDVSGRAHEAVMRAALTAKNEQELTATLIATCWAGGCVDQSYPPIVAAGENAATLHYVNNDAPLVNPATGARRLNLLLDAGSQCRTYCADITRVFPLSGKFTEKSLQIYNIVLDMQTVCLGMIKAGVEWDDVHTVAHKTMIKGLLKIGILKGSPDEILEKGVSVAFYPHGLGHYLGMETHDVGGNPKADEKVPMFRYLRLRAKLPVNSVVTVEPGCYFCRFIIEPYLKSPELSKYIDAEVLDKYWEVGGVRIEDNVVVTATGYDNLTSVPKNAEEIERIVQSGAK